MTVNIGFFGLGNMGHPMALRLVEAGHSLIVSDLNQDAVQRFCEETSSEASTGAEHLGSSSQVIITMLPEGKAVRDVLIGENGVVPYLKPGAVLIDMSSSSPVGTRSLAKELETLNFDLIDAPVSGGVRKAVDGSLAIMAGGNSGSIQKVLPLLQVLGKVFETGGPGTGHAMKAMNNFVSATTLAATTEAILTGSEFGLKPETMIEILNASTGANNSAEHKFPNFILPRTFDSGFFMGLMAKDLRFAKELAETMGTPHELLNDVSAMWNGAEDDLGFTADNTEIFKYLEQQSTSPDES